MKKILCIILLSPTFLQAQKSKIHGVVTYFFNEYQGNKPDLGAKVYAADSTKCAYDDEIAFQYELALMKYKDRSDTAFKSIDLVNAKNNKALRECEAASSTTVDATGSYNIELAPGTYYIIIQSKGRTRTSLTDIMGQVYYRKLRVAADETVDVSHNFQIE